MTGQDPSHLLAAAKQAFSENNHARAAELCRAVLFSQPSAVDALALLGMIASTVNEPGSAYPLLRLTAALRPDDVNALNALAVASRQLRLFDEARPMLERALALAPDRPQLLRHLAEVHYDEKEWAKVETLLARLFVLGRLKPADYTRRGWSLFHLKRFPEAAEIFKRAVDLGLDTSAALFGQATALYEMREARQAIDLYRRVIEIDPDRLVAYTNLSALYHRHSNSEMAARVARACLARKPHFVPASVNLGMALASLGKTGEAVASFRDAFHRDPRNSKILSNIVFYSQYLDIPTDQVFDLHREWHFLHAAPLRSAAQPHGNERSEGRRLRIGYHSPDYRQHSCHSFLQPLFKRHDRESFEIFAYGAVDRPDTATEWYRQRADHWVDVESMTDSAFVTQVRRDEIDILVDLVGHTAFNRQLCFAQKPAPVQVTWLGYPGTTGLDAIDWRISDPWLTPEGTPERFSERLCNLPRVSHCFTPDGPTPQGPIDVAPAPVLANGFITFGSFNNFAKVGDRTVALWSAVLAALPTARLKLKSRYIENSEANANILDRFRAAGADLGRISFLNGTAYKHTHLALYNEIDIGLDTFPYGGMTTTCEALWMGVPVVTLTGDRTSSRYGLSVLASLGLEELAAPTEAGFVDIARRLAADTAALATLKGGLRERMLASPLCDEIGFTRAMERAFRDMWVEWCRKSPA